MGDGTSIEHRPNILRTSIENPWNIHLKSFGDIVKGENAANIHEISMKILSKIYENLWNIYENLRKSVKMSENLRKSFENMKICGNLWKAVKIYENL